MDVADLLAGRTRETKIRRDAQGRWWNGDERIDHAGVARSFDGWLERTSDGRFCLANEINWAYVQVEGPAYFVRSVRFEGDDVMLHLSGDRVERLDVASLRTGDDGALYCDVQDGTLSARFDNHAAMQLGERLVDGEAFDLGGKRVTPKLVADPLASRSSRGKREP